MDDLTFFSSCLSKTFSISFDSSDLNNFKTQTVRSAVNVRDGQGVVLLCGPPLNSGGEFAISVVKVFCEFCLFIKCDLYKLAPLISHSKL